jgi:hypothetical protein
VQLPFVPDTANVTTSAARSGLLWAPTLSGAGRVSTSRHGTIGTYTDALAAPVAPTDWAKPMAMTVAAAIAAATVDVHGRRRGAASREHCGPTARRVSVPAQRQCRSARTHRPVRPCRPSVRPSDRARDRRARSRAHQVGFHHRRPPPRPPDTDPTELLPARSLLSRRRLDRTGTRADLTSILSLRSWIRSVFRRARGACRRRSPWQRVRWARPTVRRSTPRCRSVPWSRSSRGCARSPRARTRHRPEAGGS